MMTIFVASKKKKKERDCSVWSALFLTKRGRKKEKKKKEKKERKKENHISQEKKQQRNQTEIMTASSFKALFPTQKEEGRRREGEQRRHEPNER